MSSSHQLQAALGLPFIRANAIDEVTGCDAHEVSVVLCAITQNHGAISVQSAPGVGTTFTIHVPRFAGEARLPIVAGTPNARSTGGHEAILLVEDDLAVLQVTRLALEREGYTVLGASQAQDAIRMAAEFSGRIDLLITDVVMPEMDGRTLGERILSLRPQMKRIFMSGYTPESIARRGALDENAQFLQKPFSIQALTALVRKMLDGE